MAHLPPALILAAGESSRFWPLSTHGHKSLHRLCGQAIIEHTVRSLAAAGVTEGVVVQSPISRAAHFPHRTVADQLGDGSAYGVRIRYVDQPEAAGQGDAVLRAGNLLPEEFLLVQPENVNAGRIVPALLGTPGDALAVQERDDTWLFGVCAVEGDAVTDIVEKPEPGAEPSRYCNMGVAKLTRRYVDTLREVPPSPISSVTALASLARAGNLRYREADQPFFPLKYPWHLFPIAEYLKPASGPFVAEGARLADGADLDGQSVVEADAEIGNVRLRSALVGAGSRIRADLADSICGADVTIEPGARVETRPTEGHVTVDVKGHRIDTTLPSLGAVVGQGTVIGARAVIRPGVLVGAEARVAPGAMVTGNVPDRSGAIEGAGRK